MAEIQIDQDALTEAVTFLDQFLVSKLPQYDFSPGTANRDITINSIALVFAFLRDDTATIKSGLTLFDLKDKTDDSSNEMVDAILSDFFVERHTGDVSVGPITLYFSTNVIGTITITDQNIFIKNSIEYIIKNNAVFITPSDLQSNVNSTGGTYYTYDMTVQAVEKGSTGRATAGLFSSWDISSPFLYRVEALEDFTGGEDIESSADLIVRSEKALTVKNLVTANAIYTVLMANFAFLKNVVSIGMHEAEMIRDLITYSSGNTDVTIHRGNMIDIYGKFPITFRNVESKTVATHLISGINTTAIQMEAQPIYKVRSVVDTTNNNLSIPFEVLVEDASLFLSGRQSIYLGVSEDYLGASLLVTYDLTTNYDEVQAYIESTSERTVVADSLVKAHFPLYLSFDMPIYSSTEIDANSIKNTLQDYIHSGEVEGNLFISTIVDIVTDTYNVIVQTPFVVTGNLLLPNGKTMVITYVDRIRTPKRFMIDDLGEYLPLFEGETNPNNYDVGLLSDLQISDTTTRFVLDKDDITVRRVT